MKIIILNVLKQNKNDEYCLVKFGTANAPMIFDCYMKCDQNIPAAPSHVEADVELYSHCFVSESMNANVNTHLMASSFPCNFISSTIEEIVELKLDIDMPYVKYKTTINGEVFNVTLIYPKQDEPVKDIYKVGDKIVGLFRADVSIK